MEEITLSITEAIACELALDEVLEGLRASAGRRKEGLTVREVALERMMAAARRSVGAKRQAAEDGYGRATVDPRGIVRDADGTVRYPEVKVQYREEPAVYDVHLEHGGDPRPMPEVAVAFKGADPDEMRALRALDPRNREGGAE